MAVKKALLIGINYVGQSSELSGCVNDIIDMRKLCTSLAYEEVCILYDGSLPKGYKLDLADKRIKNTKPTRENIIIAIHWLVNNAKKGDILFFHYSGHGGQLRALVPNSEKTGRDDTLLPVDYEQAGEIRDDELYALLITPLQNIGASLRIVLDCCYSGTGIDLKYNLPFSKNIDKSDCSSVDVLAISGCTDRQTSADASFEGKANGALTYYLLKLLYLSIHPRKSPRNRNIKKLGTWPTVVTLLKGLRTHMKHNGYTQKPQISSETLVTSITRFNLE